MHRMFSATVVVLAFAWPALADDAHILFIEGGASHGFGEYEHLGGSRLLAEVLEDANIGVTTQIVRAWPDASAFEDVDAIVIYADGGGNHPILDHLDQVETLMSEGVGLVLLHFAVEVPAGHGGPEILRWVGGHYEHAYSVNPIWQAAFNDLPAHPITHGVEPFSTEDEWYFNIRFRDQMQGIEPILTTEPSDDVREGPYVFPRGPYNHIVEASGCKRWWKSAAGDGAE